MSEMPSYHDLHITTPEIDRTSIFNLPFNIEVSVTRASGWQVWDHYDPLRPVKLAGEYDCNGLILDVSGHVICDSLTPTQPIKGD